MIITHHARWGINVSERSWRLSGREAVFLTAFATTYEVPPQSLLKSQVCPGGVCQTAVTPHSCRSFKDGSEGSGWRVHHDDAGGGRPCQREPRSVYPAPQTVEDAVNRLDRINIHSLKSKRRATSDPRRLCKRPSRQGTLEARDTNWHHNLPRPNPSPASC